jgi:hypothetical protein
LGGVIFYGFPLVPVSTYVYHIPQA